MNQTISISIAICVLILSGCGTSSTEPPAPTATTPPPTEALAEPTYADLPYMEDDNPKHMLDVYLPDNVTEAVPTLLMIHGALDHKEDHNEIGQYFADQGYAVIITEYQSPNDQQIGIQELFCSLAWVYANVDQYNFDSQRIYLFGYSIGGFFAATLGAMDDPGQYQDGCPHRIPEAGSVQGIITFAGLFVTQEVCLAPEGGWCMSEFASVNKIPLMELANIFESLREVPPVKWRDSSELSDEARHFVQGLPLYWLDGSEPPFLIIHGDADEMVPVGESEAFADALQANGVEVELVKLPGAGHFALTLSSPSFEKIAEAIAAFLSE